jgi:NAD(P)-dependent dehydrogenase (short-subunit alcohol dehydrogenase family)
MTTMATTAPITSKYTSKLRNKRVLVLGGTSGIGFCVAEASIESGATVIVSSSRQPKIDTTIERIKSSYPDCEARISGHACDLANTETLEQNLEDLLKFATSGGKEKLDHVVFTAGDSFALKGLVDMTVDSIQKLPTVRFVAVILLAKLLVPKYITSSAKSSITLTGGVNSTKPGAGWSVLAGWGAAIEGLVRGFAVDLKPIRVNCVAPGAVNTELVQSFAGDRLDAILKHFRDMTTTGAVGRPEDLAEAYLYCMKDRFVTGSVLHSNGGHLLT